MLSFLDPLLPPEARAPLTAWSFVADILPPYVCYFATAYLVILPQTRPIRIALWPITAVLTLRAATRPLDASRGQPALHLLNMDLMLSMAVILFRTLEWTVQNEPFVRHRPVSQSRRNYVFDALDLAYNLRGLGWDWSKGLRVPPDARPTSSRLSFATYTLISALKHASLYAFLHCVIRSFSPLGQGLLDGSTIFDDSLPPHLRYLRSSIIATLTAFYVFASLQITHEFPAVLGVVVFRQHPDQWPPILDSPWSATSLREFWGRRWHQWYRRLFTFFGGRPLSVVFGRPGAVIGTFLASGMYHYIILISLDPSIEMWPIIMPFGMMGVGLVLEQAVAGKNVGGWTGWFWTMFWLVLWGNMVADAFARAGMLAGPSTLDNTPLAQPIERLVRAFDEYLHTL